MRMRLNSAAMIVGAAAFALLSEWHLSSTTQKEPRARREWVDSPAAAAQLQELVVHGPSPRQLPASDSRSQLPSQRVPSETRGLVRTKTTTP